MYYPDELVEEIRSKNDIVDVISQTVHLTKKNGNSYWGLCPFHNEHTPSFCVTPSKNMYKCFGCNVGGDVFNFVMRYENVSYPEAIRKLGERAGVQLPEREMTEQERRRKNEKQRLYDLNKEATAYFYAMLRTPKGEKGMAYLRGRALTDETMQKFGLGYAGVDGRYVVEHLRSKGFKDEEIIKSGIATHNERRGLTSQFWNRVMFPICDVQNRVIGFGGRVMGDGEPKYLNSPETVIFDKRRNLFGMNYAKAARTNNIIICEGYMDVISMHQAGFTQAVASLGTAFTPEQALLLKRYTNRVLLAYDSDGAGVKAAIRNIGILRDVGLTGRVINMKPYKDPDEFIKALGKEAFQERIDQAENSFAFEIRILAENYNMQDPDERTEFQREIAKKLLVFEDSTERENYLQAICEQYMIHPDFMKESVAKQAAAAVGAKPLQRPQSGMMKTNPAQDAGKRLQGMLLTWLTDEPEIYASVRKYIEISDFTVELYREAAEELFRQLETGSIHPASIISRYESEDDQTEIANLFQTQMPHMESEEERSKAFRDIIVGVRKNSNDFYAKNPPEGMDPMQALQASIARKKALEELMKTNITL